MNTINRHPVRNALAWPLAGAATIVSSMVVNGLLAPFSPFQADTDQAFFRLWIGSQFMLGCALLYLLRQSRHHGLRLLGLGLLVYVGSAQVMQHIETIAFNFLFGFSPATIVFLVLSQLAGALVLMPLIITIAGKWRRPDLDAPDRCAGFLPASPRTLAGRLAMLSVAWIASYWLAGYFIADPVTHQYYLAKNPALNDINWWLFPLQALRGLLWTGLFILAIRLMNRPLPEGGVLVGLLFGVFHAIALLVPSPFMPTEMRLSHLPEIVASLVFQGGMTATVLAWRPSARRTQAD